MFKNQSWFNRNPKKTLFFSILIFTIIILLAFEIFLRFYIKYNPGYYMYETGQNNSVRYFPYGKIIINSDGFADDEFLHDKIKPRVGYLGDSVLYGLGAGHGYRITELFEKDFSQYEHMNLAYIGFYGVNSRTLPWVLGLVSYYQVDKIIYFMCMNDIMPSVKKTANLNTGTKPVRKIQAVKDNFFYLRKIGDFFDFLRGKSYLFTHIRFMIKNYYFRRGYNERGFTAYEFFPEKYRFIFSQTAGRIAVLERILEKRNVDFLVVILPYEMQISSEAEAIYKDDKIKWEEDFIDRGPQKTIINDFEKFNIKYIDAIYAFIDEKNVQASRDENKIGEFFVYNKGDRLDWVHPNREGHKKIADFLAKRLKETGFF